MTEKQEPLKTFDLKDVEEIIERFKKSGFTHIKGQVNFELSGTFAILEVQTETDRIKGDDPENPSPGIFLLFPRHDLTQLVKAVFDLNEKSDQT